MNPILIATLRRRWPVAGAAAILVLFLLVHELFFQPAARRYKAAVKAASEAGLALDPGATPAMMPPRVFALVAENTLPAAEAQERGNSGILTANLLEDVTRLLGRHGLEVLMTEPGAVVQQQRSVQVRAYLKVRGRYRGFVSMLDELAHGTPLVAVDRFTMVSSGSGSEVIDLWVSRYVLKQEKGKK